jgi:hypothetical protein
VNLTSVQIFDFNERMIRLEGRENSNSHAGGLASRDSEWRSFVSINKGYFKEIHRWTTRNGLLFFSLLIWSDRYLSHKYSHKAGS